MRANLKMRVTNAAVTEHYAQRRFPELLKLTPEAYLVYGVIRSPDIFYSFKEVKKTGRKSRKISCSHFLLASIKCINNCWHSLIESIIVCTSPHLSRCTHVMPYKNDSYHSAQLVWFKIQILRECYGIITSLAFRNNEVSMDNLLLGICRYHPEWDYKFFFFFQNDLNSWWIYKRAIVCKSNHHDQQQHRSVMMEKQITKDYSMICIYFTSNDFLLFHNFHK